MVRDRVQSGSRPSPKWFETESKEVRVQDKSKSKEVRVRVKTESKVVRDRVQRGSSPSQDRVQRGSRSSPSPNEMVKTEKEKNYLLQNHILNY